MRKLFRRIRVRLTLWYGFLLAVALIVFGVALHAVLAVRLYEELDDTLLSYSALVIGTLEAEAETKQAIELGQSLLSGNPPAEDLFIRVLDSSGRLIEQNNVYEMAASPIDSTVIAKALAGRRVFNTVHLENDTVRTYTVPVYRGEQVTSLVQLGLSAEDVVEILNALRWTTLLILPVTLTIASIGGVILASRALRPVDRITRTAQSITASDLGQRLDLDLPDDELGRLARTLDAMIDRLDVAFRRQHRFTADASHELRTPLTIIKGDLSVALSRSRNADYYRTVLIEIDKEVDVMSRLVHRLLSLARVDADGIPLRRQSVDLGVLLADMVEQLRPFAESKSLELTTEISPDLMVKVDPDAITEVVLNLLDNAIKYTRSGRVRLRAHRTRGDMLCIVVSDTGPGIPPEPLAHIFERFYRVDRARSRELGGAGLGLSIARELARAHGGDVTVHSIVNEGSTFTVNLPVE